MSVGAIYIVLGAGLLVWRRWVLTVLFRDVKRIGLPARRQHYEALLQRSGPKRVFAAVWVCGIALMFVGVVLLLNR
jgi:UDP-N-acetylmuramyl pentapeptide phosphotransferase/UDP-N-acetylglucosamine-1-phosphate transferase